MIEGIVAGIVKGIIQPLLSWWTNYRHGRLAKRAEGLEATLEKQHEVDAAVAAVRDDLRGAEYELDPATGRVRRVKRG